MNKRRMVLLAGAVLLTAGALAAAPEADDKPLPAVSPPMSKGALDDPGFVSVELAAGDLVLLARGSGHVMQDRDGSAAPPLEDLLAGGFPHGLKHLQHCAFQAEVLLVDLVQHWRKPVTADVVELRRDHAAPPVCAAVPPVSRAAFTA